MSTQNAETGTLAGPRADVVILPGTFSFDVVPPVLFVEGGTAYVIRNLTRSRVHVSFPAGSIASPTNFTLEPKGNASDRHTFTTLTNVDGVFEYTVVIALTETDSIRATGGSDPKIVYN